MDFNARQYDPQIGRFLGVDLLADAGGQDMFSPYAAMGNIPQSMIDPEGLAPRDGDVLFPASPDGMTGTQGGWAGWGKYGGWAKPEVAGLGVGLGGNSRSIFDQFNLGVGAGFPGLVANAEAAARERTENQTTGQTSNANKNAGVQNNDATNLGGKNGKKEPVGPFSPSDPQGDIPETSKWDLDGDGKLSISEAKNWHKTGLGQSVEVDAAQIDIGYIDTKDMKKG